MSEENSPMDFITGAFPIVVGTLASEDAEHLCHKNDLSFIELIRPFCQLDSEAQIHDPVNPNIVITVKKLKIRIVDIQSPLPPPVLVNRVLSEVVSKTVSVPDLKSVLSLEDQVNSPTPWYEAHRDCFFQLLQPMNHEFIRDIMACILVVSTKHPDPIQAFAALNSRQNSIQHSPNKPKGSLNWFVSNPLKYYLLLHDASEGQDEKAEAVYQNLKSIYGSHTCFLLQINSRQKMYPDAIEKKMSFSDPWTQYIYPFSDETFDIDESEIEADSSQKSPLVDQKDADKKEEAIINELENIDRQIEQNPQSPRTMSFNDPLTSMHYNDTLEDDSEDFGPLSLPKTAPVESSFRPRKISEKSLKLFEYKKSLHQLSYSNIGTMSASRKERGHCMTLMDQDKIKAFVYEFTIRGLLPYMEKMMRTLSEQILARRGIHKSIFHATKKWFGGNKTSGGGVGVGFSAGLSYDNDSAELQYRKLGDLSFLVQHYDLAYNSYHTAKREFNNDHAWMYFAGALEMAAISAFMQGSVRVYPVHYFEACITTYLDTCRMADFATRACLLSTEALRYREMYKEAAVELIKLTNEDSDLRSALFLEQAAHCYISHKPPMVRKYAFHMILAGHRYNKAAQRKHTLRCYINALQVYASKGWCLAEDHVNFTIGRQSFNLGNLDDSQLALKSLLMYESEQPVAQQASYLREFLAVFKQNLVSLQNGSTASSCDRNDLILPALPLPEIRCNVTRCLLYVKEPDKYPKPGSPTTPSQRRSRTVNAGAYTFQRNYSNASFKKWSNLELKMVTFVTGSAPYPFKPFSPCLSKDTENKMPPVIAVNELFAYEIQFANPLKIPLNLIQLSLLWEFIRKDTDALVTNRETDGSEYVWTEVIENFQLNASETKAVPLQVRAKHPGCLKILGVRYTLSSVAVTSSVDEYGKSEYNTHQEVALNTVGVTGMQPLVVQGSRLFSSKQERASIIYAVDKRLDPLILPSLPLLQVKMMDLPVTLLCGEVQKSVFHFKNIGQIALKNLHVICDQAEYFSFDIKTEAEKKYNIQTFEGGKIDLQIDSNLKDAEKDIIQISLDNDSLPPNGEIAIPVYVYGMTSPGVHEVSFLFYYEPEEKMKEVPYRLVQQMIRLQTLNSLNMSLSARLDNHDDTIAGVENVVNQELLLSLSIENQAQAGQNVRCVEFDLKRIACYSCKWEVRSLVNLSRETYKLRPGETCSLHLKTKSLAKTKDMLASSSNIYLCDDMQWTPGKESLDLFMKPVNNIDSVLNSLGLILYWETFYIDEGFTRVVIKGQTHATVDVSPNQWCLNPVGLFPTITNGIDITYDFPSVVQHDFDSSRLCVVEIVVKCSNITERNVIIEIEAVDVHEDGPINTSMHTLSLIQWVGQRQISVEVSAHSSQSLLMHAMFGTVGVYEIRNINAYVDNYTESGLLEKVSLNLPSSPLICIRNVQSKEDT